VTSPSALKVLYATYNTPYYMPPLILSDQQIIVGPHYSTRIDDGIIKSINAPGMSYDLSKVVSSFPDRQKPELTVALVGGYMAHVPVNLGRVPGRKVLLITDTHHGNLPIRSLIEYTRREKFHKIAVIHDPHHLHWFAESGLEDVRWVPNVDVEDFGLELCENRKVGIIFVGQVGQVHPRRLFMIEAIRAAGLAIDVYQTPAAEAAALYNSTQVSFNCSLNGDLNMRVFEVLAAGGFLITDRLSPQAGLESFFRAGEHYVDYVDAGDLVEKLRYYLTRPDLCLQIARAGRQAYQEAHKPSDRVRQLRDLAFGAPAPWPIHDPRAATASPGFGERLDERVGLYEMLQGLSRNNEMIVVAADAEIGARAVSDLVDLPRLKVHVVVPPDQTRAMEESLQSLGVLGQVHIVGQTPADTGVLIVDRVNEDRPFGDRNYAGACLAVMSADPMSERAMAQLTALGFTAAGDIPGLFVRTR